MANPLIVKVTLDDSDVEKAAARTKRRVKSALDDAGAEAEKSAARVKRSTKSALDGVGEEAEKNAKRVKRSVKSAMDDAGSEVEKGAARMRRGAKTAIDDIGKDIERGAEKAKRGAKTALDQIGDSAARAGQKINSGLNLSLAKSTVAALGLAVAVKRIGSAAVDSAIDTDRQRNTLTALTGSAEAAAKKIAELRKLAADTPGLTATQAISSFNQLKAVGTIAESTIERLTKSMAKLNAVFTIESPREFLRNLQQIFDQDFERPDIKQALGQVPIFEQLLKSAFGTDDADILREMKKRGELTSEAFFLGFANAVDRDSRLVNISESIGSKFEKVKERAFNALAPLGIQILETIIPPIERLTPYLEKIIKFIASIPDPMKDTILQIGLLYAALSPVVGLLGNIPGVAGLAAAAVAKLIPQIAALSAASQGLLLGGLGAVIGVGVGVGVYGANKTIAQVNERFDAFARQQEANAPRTQAQRDAEISGALANVDPATLALLNKNRKIQLKAAPSLADGITGKPKGAGGGDAAAAAKAIADARLSYLQAGRENELQLIRDASERELDVLRTGYEQGKILTRDYYNERYEIAKSAALAEIALLQTNAGQIETQLKTATGAERFKLLEKLGDLTTQIELKQRNLLTSAVDSLREYQKEVQKVLTGPNLDSQEQVAAGPEPKLITDARERLTRLRAEGLEYTRIDSELRIKEIQIQNAVNAGVLTENEGRKAVLALQREQRDAMIAALEAQRELAAISGDEGQIQRLNEQIEGLRGLGVELTNTQRFLRGIGSEAEDIGDIFERFGRNVANSFRSIKGVFDGLKNAVKSFFADLLGNSLQNLLKNTLGVLFGGRAAASGSGGGGIGAIFGGIGNLFGGGAAGGGGFATGGLPSILRPSVFNPALGGAGGKLGGLPSILRPSVFNPALGGAGGKLGGLGGLFGNVFGGLGSLFKGIGFGKAGGTGGALASALPLLGVSLGAGLGGSSGLGQILGGVGGGLLGVGLTAAPASLGALGFLAPLFSNPITAIVGAALLPAAFLLGRAKQRGKDERASGDFLQQAIDAIRELRAGVESGSVSGAQARQIFESQILGTFIQQVNTLKTKSVRESRLTNQVRDLRNLFEAEVVPAIALAKSKGTVNDKLIPEFATGGFKSGTGLALLHHGEAILNTAQQSRLSALAGPNVLQAIGVPNAATNAPAPTPAFAAGGVFRSEGPMVIELSVNVGLSDDDARQITIAGARTADGRDVIVRTVRAARRDGEL